MKEQLDASLCVYKVVKVFLYERHTVFIWEASYEQTGSGASITNQESGWVLIQPASIADCRSLSVVRLSMKRTASEANTIWLQLTARSDMTTKGIGPSYQQIMQHRLQLVENRLMDGALQT